MTDCTELGNFYNKAQKELVKELAEMSISFLLACMMSIQMWCWLVLIGHILVLIACSIAHTMP